VACLWGGNLQITANQAMTQNQQTVHCEVVTKSVQTVEAMSGHREPTQGIVGISDRVWTECRRRQWT
jgi:hypothetical protein